jgi:hypothetical protein
MLVHTCTYLYVLILYQFKPVTYHRWTAAELKKVITMLQHPDFDSKDIDPDLHKRMAKAVDDGRIQQFRTSTARTRVRVSRRVVQTLLRRMAGAAATSTRLTRGCGSLDVASLAWAA